MNAEEAQKLTEFALSPMSDSFAGFVRYADKKIAEKAEEGERSTYLHCLYPKWSEIADLLVAHYKTRGFRARRANFLLRLLGVDHVSVSWPGRAPSCR